MRGAALKPKPDRSQTGEPRVTQAGLGGMNTEGKRKSQKEEAVVGNLQR